MRQREIQRNLKKLIPEMHEFFPEMSDEPVLGINIGSVYNLDPCGKYHHFLSPNGVTKKCELFWENLETSVENLGGWIDSSDDMAVFFCMPMPEKLCPICGESITLEKYNTKDGRLIGSCGDAFTQAQWESED